MRVCLAIRDKSPACMPKSPKIPQQAGHLGAAVCGVRGNSGLA